jgi:hypothetical protein
MTEAVQDVLGSKRNPYEIALVHLEPGRLERVAPGVDPELMVRRLLRRLGAAKHRRRRRNQDDRSRPFHVSSPASAGGPPTHLRLDDVDDMEPGAKGPGQVTRIGERVVRSRLEIDRDQDVSEYQHGNSADHRGRMPIRTFRV